VIAARSQREVADSRGLIARLLHLGPDFGRTLPPIQLNRPHVIQACIAVIASKDPQPVVIGNSPVGSSRSRRHRTRLRVPLDPLTRLELVLEFRI